MKRGLKSEEAALWGHVTATVHPLGARQAPGQAFPAAKIERPTPPAPPDGPPSSPKALEPRRARRLARERDAVGGRLDLHGLDQDQARAALMRFLDRAQAEGSRAVMVITGRGVQGDGVLRKRAPEWLAEPALREVVAGVAEAHRRHGGDGALYVALKRRKPR
ncbi:MAG TPA: Smr/MutS family protein [Caulobacteraceae bacterium]|jgi:DNA-nicking Smr family endonuclease|nr:Smr/MutS family protein [Caulobacteraceae bacterium]